MIKRNKNIIYLSHCILNQNSVVRDWERAEGPFTEIIKIALDYNISMIQLPCPEFVFLGEAREPKNKEQYDNLEYRNACSDLARDVASQIKEYVTQSYNIVGIVGIEESPSCDILRNRGIFMEELFELLDKENIKLSCFEISEDYEDGKNESDLIGFINFIKENIEKN